jgi:hypothetical protein
LPVLGVIIPLTWGVVVATRQAQYKKPVVIIACAWLLLVIFSTVSETRLWADPERQAREWITRHPESPRAMNYLANMYLKSGNVATTLKIFKKISSLYPGEVYPALRVIALRGCALDQETGDREWASLTKNAATATRDSFNSNVSEINAIVSAYGDNDCPGIDDGKLLKLLMALADNPHFGHMKVHLYDQAALLSLYKGDIYNAVRYVQQAINLSPSVPRQIFRAKLQLALGDIKAAGDTCSWIEQRFASNLRDRLAYKRDFDGLKEMIDGARKGDKRQD